MKHKLKELKEKKLAPKTSNEDASSEISEIPRNNFSFFDEDEEDLEDPTLTKSRKLTE